MKFLTSSLIGAALVVGALTTPAAADTILFSTFGAGETYSTSNAWCVSGNTTTNCGPQTDRWLAGSFTPGQTATLTEVDLALLHFSGVNSAEVDLVVGLSGHPGTSVLEAWQPLTTPNTVGSVLKLTSAASLSLVAGTQYWIVAKSLSGSTLDVWENSPNAGALSLLSLDDGLTWSNTTQVPAFAVFGTTAVTAVPEPVTLSLFSAGLLGIGFLYCRRVSKRSRAITGLPQK